MTHRNMDDLTIIDYIRLLWRRKAMIAVVTACVLLFAMVIVLVMPKTYQGETILIFPQEQGQTLASQLSQIKNIPLFGNLAPPTGPDVYKTILSSRTVNTYVLKQMGLDKFDFDYKDMQKQLVLDTPKEGGLVVTFEVPTSWLHGHVPSQELKQRTSELAADTANAYIARLRDYDQSSSMSMSKKHRTFIEGQLHRTKIELTAAEERLRSFQEKHPTLAMPENSSVYGEQVMALAKLQIEATVGLGEAEGQLVRARATWANGAPANVTPEAVMDSAVLRDMRAELARLEVQRATLLEDFTEEHPQVVGITQQMEKTRSEIAAEAQRIISGKVGSASPAHQELLKQLVLLEVARDGMSARKSALDRSMANIEHQLTGLPAQEIVYVRLLRDMRAAEAVYTTLLTELAKARVTEGMDDERFIVLDEAVPERRPAKPKMSLVLAGALIMGFFLAAWIALIQESTSAGSC